MHPFFHQTNFVMNPNPQILTPDQRLRVFVSSTLQELADERVAVKQAIQNIHLTPVMFEMGARPHAPRQLYREYLAQSQIFIGIYWDRYGWVAPEENISGLEDEYNLSGNMPKLIYIKQSTGHREDRLTQLLQRIQSDDKVSYKTFTTADELGSLIVNDLALLLTERFNLTIQNKMTEAEYTPFHAIPSIPNTLIGREQSVKEVIAILQSPSKRLVTLTGPGGIGKSRLAMEIATQLKDSYPDGAAYVALAPVNDPTLVAETICYALGIKVSGGNNVESIKLFLQDKKFLLVLDNFEQIIQAAAIIEDLLMGAPGLKIIVTSRERLALSFENVYAVPTLPDTCPEQSAKDCEVIPPAIQLFIQRAKAIQPSFALNDQNRETIFNICHRLEGLPLAIELAAGQINLFSPAVLLKKLDHRLDVLKGNFRDIPDRQKTIRNTIEWSFDLLSPAEQDLLLQISLYSAGCLLDTVEHMKLSGEEEVYTLLASLIDKSLLMKEDDQYRVRYQMLESVREFAIEKLKAHDQYEAYRQGQAEYYHRALQGLKLERNKSNQVENLKFLEKEHPNIRFALDYLMQHKDLRKVTEIAWNLWLFWWVNAHTKEGYTWMRRAWDQYQADPEPFDEYTFAMLATNVGTMSFLQRDLKTFNESLVANFELVQRQPDDELVATASLITGVVKTIIREYDVAHQLLQMSLDRFRKIGLTTGVSLALSALGRNAIYHGDQIAAAKEYYKESMAVAKQDNDEISVIICLSGFALCEVMEKNSSAKNYLRESILLSQSLHFYEALAWSIEIGALVSINENNFLRGVTLMGAVDHLRSSTQLPVWDDLETIMVEAKHKVQQQMDPAIFDQAWKEGVAMSLDRMVAFALEA
jgi:predicted ATPase